MHIFLLSPANCGGTRGTRLLNGRESSALAERLRTEGAPIGDVFTALSGLYFRGKIEYARRFANPPDPACPIVAGGVLIITPNAGLRGADTPITLAALRCFSTTDVDAGNEAYRRPLVSSARIVAERLGTTCDVILLGSIATAKYVDALLEVFGPRLKFPVDFVGRGDMSRGGLLLRRASSGEELPYARVDGAVRHGPRPARLGPKP